MLREEIKLKLNEALKNKDKKCTSTLRLVLAATKDRDIAARSKGNNTGISEDEIKLLLQTMIKQRKESSQIYEKAGRDDLLQAEKEEIWREEERDATSSGDYNPKTGKKDKSPISCREIRL